MPRVIHFEIQAEDPERAVKFYRDVLGWEIQKWDGPMDYWLIKTGPKEVPGINGGLMRRHERPGGGAALAYVCVVDVLAVDDYVRRAVEAGGQVAMPKSEIPGVGWLAYVKDTEGNTFGMLQPMEAAHPT